MQCKATRILTLLLLQGSNLHGIPGQMGQTQKDCKLAAAITLDAYRALQKFWIIAYDNAVDGVDGCKLTTDFVAFICFHDAFM